MKSIFSSSFYDCPSIVNQPFANRISSLFILKGPNVLTNRHFNNALQYSLYNLKYQRSNQMLFHRCISIYTGTYRKIYSYIWLFTIWFDTTKISKYMRYPGHKCYQVFIEQNSKSSFIPWLVLNEMNNPLKWWRVTDFD